MSHLLAVSIGPVQEFIAAARRTRDLWFGSYLLSEVSKAAAKCIQERQGTLVFPHPQTDLESGHPEISVANVILAELPSGEPKEIATEAEKAARDRWREFANQALQDASTAVHNEIWQVQVVDVIEFYAAWVPHANPSDYPRDRARVMRLLAGRKNCRDFLPAKGRAGVPKSSLDGQRETVLKGSDRTHWPRRLRLTAGEQLDVVGVVKRLGKRKGESDPRYPSVARVAAEIWLRGVKDREGFQGLVDACAAVPDLNEVREPKYGYFPHEGTVIFKNRHSDLIAELGDAAREPLKRVAKELGKFGGEPLPYVAVLVADGDSMGAVISNQKTIDEHQRFSHALAGFAGEARRIVTDHDGALIYAGGDDVLAFLPVHKCLGCARGLHDKFGDLLKEHTNEKREPPTLSVGIAIGHFMENLEDLRDYGLHAEKAAKAVKGKDALAVHLHKRGGETIRVCGQWKKSEDADTDKLDKRLRCFSELIRDEAIPGKLSYDLREMARLYEPWTDKATEAMAIRLDLNRLLLKKQTKGVGDVRERMAPYIADMTAKKLLSLSRELLVARLIATALVQSGEVAP